MTRSWSRVQGTTLTDPQALADMGPVPGHESVVLLPRSLFERYAEGAPVTGFPDCFDEFRVSAFRLETLRQYAVPAEDERIAAFREHRPLPERSVRTSPWLRRIADTTAAGKRWSRVHVVDEPLSEYVRFEMVTYRESAQAGEEIRIADRRADPALDALQTDFWLFDARD